MIDYGLWCKGWMTDDTVVRVRFQVQKMVCASLREFAPLIRHGDIRFYHDTFTISLTCIFYQDGGETRSK